MQSRFARFFLLGALGLSLALPSAATARRGIVKIVPSSVYVTRPKKGDHYLDAILQKVPKDAFWGGMNATNKGLDLQVVEVKGAPQHQKSSVDPAEDGIPVSRKKGAWNIVVTGVNQKRGGAIGDGTTDANNFASVTDLLLANPNTYNAYNWNNLAHNVGYLEGEQGDAWLRNGGALYVTKEIPKIALVYGKTSDRNRAILKNTVGVFENLYYPHGKVEMIETAEDPGARVVREGKSKTYTGRVENVGTILDAVDKAMKKRSKRPVDHLALSFDFPPDSYDANEYEEHLVKGNKPNPMGRLEANISHAIGRYAREKYGRGTAAAHGPLTTPPFIKQDQVVLPRSAGEPISLSGILSVLIGLKQAPFSENPKHLTVKDKITLDNLVAMIAAPNALGGFPQLTAAKLGIPIIVDDSNGTMLNVTDKKLGLTNTIHFKNNRSAVQKLEALTQAHKPRLVAPLVKN